MITITVTDAQRFMMDNDSSYNEAARLAMSLVKRHWPENDEFSLCDSTCGVISQIDNMTTSLERKGV